MLLFVQSIWKFPVNSQLIVMVLRNKWNKKNLQSVLWRHVTLLWCQRQWMKMSENAKNYSFVENITKHMYVTRGQPTPGDIRQIQQSTQWVLIDPSIVFLKMHFYHTCVKCIRERGSDPPFYLSRTYSRTNGDVLKKDNFNNKIFSSIVNFNYIDNLE